MSHPHIASLAHRSFINLLASEDNLPAIQVEHTGYGFDKFRLPIATHPRDCDNFTLTHLKGNMRNSCESIHIGNTEILDFQHHITRLNILLLYPQQNLA